jgi:uncharacterized SAM-binding protein YcdF (DUF218 family)
MTYTQPLILLTSAIALAGVLRMRRGWAKVAGLSGVLGLLLIAWPPMDWLLSRPLEGRYPVRPFAPPPGLQAIVVLSGSVEKIRYERPYIVADMDTYSRCEHAAWIYRHSESVPVLACGGTGGAGPVSVTMRELLRRAGVPDNMIWTEEFSHSTHENAVFGAKVLRKHGIQRIALVTEAQSMPRAEACFRKEGLIVTPAPSDFRTFGTWDEELIPNWKAIRRNEIALHEGVGLISYWLRGWI